MLILEELRLIKLINKKQLKKKKRTFKIRLSKDKLNQKN